MDKEERKDTLLKMHAFYGEEARHQRMMMWETVKWFTPILVAIHGTWWWVLLRKFPNAQQYELLYLITLSIGGILLSLICLLILNRFYRSDLIYITMFAKVEDELEFDKRDRKTSFSEDNSITYEHYLVDRKNFRTAEGYVRSALPRIRSLYSYMSFVFWLFISASIVEVIVIFIKKWGENMHALLQLAVIFIALLGAFLLAFGLKVEKQYSEDLIKELKLKEKRLLIISEVTQREKLFKSGLGLLTLSAILQAICIYLY